MTSVEPLEGLTGLAGPIDPRPEFAQALLDSCLAELAPLRRARPARRRRLQVALVVVLAALVVAAVATATYLALRGSGAVAPTGPEQLTVISPAGGRTTGPHPDLAQVALVDRKRRLRVVWECPNHTWCGTLTSIAWSPDGRKLALTLDELGGTSGYIGLHVIDIASGRDTQLGVPGSPADRARPQTFSVLRRIDRQIANVLGCWIPHELAWSPDSTRLAYICGNDFLSEGSGSALFVIRPDGTDRLRIRTRTRGAYWPSWAPDGNRIAFASGPRPSAQVYTIRLDGAERTLIARHATAPAWSPDGSTIAYDTPCGVRFATMRGASPPVVELPACLRVGGAGLPVWSPDGTRLAVATTNGIQLFDSAGAHPRHATDVSGAGLYALARPAWAPDGAVTRLLSRRATSGL